MGYKKGLILRDYPLSILLFLIVGCDYLSNKSEPINVNSYYIEDDYKSADCNIYKMIFNDGKYLFRFALAGRCKELTNSIFIEEYKLFFKKYLKAEGKDKKGLVLIEHETLKITPSFEYEILNSTINIYNNSANVSLIESNEKHTLLLVDSIPNNNR